MISDSQLRVSVATSVQHRFRIVGAGPTGALLALGLAQQGFDVLLCDRLTRDQILQRSRAYAITQSSRRLLQRLDLWDELSAHLTPFRSLRLEDCAIRRSTWFTLSDLRAANRPSNAIGWILDHRPLMHLLMTQLGLSERVSLHLGEGAATDADFVSSNRQALTIAADGPHSSLRTAAGVPFWSHRYRQGCLTAKLRLEGADQGCAYELFRPEGPMAVLPLGGDCFQVVWSAPLRRCQERAVLSPDALLTALNAILPPSVNAVELLDEPGAFPLELSLAPRLHHGSLLLVGEAGHRCHPVGGQGLNLCWRDVGDLLDLTDELRTGSVSPQSLPRRYSRRRNLDLTSVLLSTDLLIRLFSNRHPLLLPLRHGALLLLDRCSWLRRLSLSAMSDGPGSVLTPLPQ